MQFIVTTILNVSYLQAVYKQVIKAENKQNSKPKDLFNDIYRTMYYFSLANKALFQATKRQLFYENKSEIFYLYMSENRQDFKDITFPTTQAR